MELKMTEKLKKRILDGKVKLLDIKQTRHGCRAKITCSKIEVHFEDLNNPIFKFYNNRLHVASIGPVYVRSGETITLIGLKSTLDIRVT